MMISNTITAITTATTTPIATGEVQLFSVICPLGTGLVGTATFNSTAGVPYFVLPIGTSSTLEFRGALANGLSVVTSVADNIIINWHQ